MTLDKLIEIIETESILFGNEIYVDYQLECIAINQKLGNGMVESQGYAPDEFTDGTTFEELIGVVRLWNRGYKVVKR